MIDAVDFASTGYIRLVFSPTSIDRAVDLQERSYKLLVWMTNAIERGFISFDAAHTYSTLPEATYVWLDRHYLDVPPAARPEREDLRGFCNLFSTYLESSFDLIRDPGQRRFSEGAHCFCPMCSWLIPMPRLQTKKLTRADKKRARKMQIAVIRDLAAEHDCSLSDEIAERLADDPALREGLALAAYGRDLLRRLDGVADGPASLALWRTFAWTPQGSPKQNFTLTSTAILGSERLVFDRIKASATAT